MLDFLTGRKRRALEADLESVRLRIARAALEHGAQAVSLVGVGSGAGVTTLASWIAGTFAREGRKVLLVEANRATPRLHKLFRIPQSPGVREVLGGKVPPEQAIHPVNGAQLSVLSCGGGAPGPSSVERWSKLLGQLRHDGTLVLVDAGQVEEPSTLAVAAASDGVVLVVEAGSRWEVVAAAVERLEGQGAVLLGVILNKRRYPIPDFVYHEI
jgi:Mrp family chromosome partitioning ATPase